VPNKDVLGYMGPNQYSFGGILYVDTIRTNWNAMKLAFTSLLELTQVIMICFR
jgi:hypothetical protein